MSTIVRLAKGMLRYGGRAPRSLGAAYMRAWQQRSVRLSLAVVWLFACTGEVPGAEETRQAVHGPSLDGGSQVSSPAASLRPVANCVSTDSAGKMVAQFGYVNSASTAQWVPIGPFNALYPGRWNQGQPTHFVPGRKDNVVELQVDPRFRWAMWTLRGGVAVASKDSPSCGPSFVGATSAIATSNHLVSLFWTAATDSTTPSAEMVYDVCVSTTARACGSNFQSTFTTSPGAKMWTIAGLSAATHYYFVVRARNHLGLRDTNTVEVSASTTRNASRAISAGVDLTCELLPAATVQCWGYDFYGQVGDGGSQVDVRRFMPVPVEGVNGVASLAAGAYHVCSLLTDGTMRCWGNNDYQEAPALGPGLTNVVDISSGYEHTCAVLTGDTVQCWGYNVSGQLGDGSTTNRSTPVAVGTANLTSVSAGRYHTCAVSADGVPQCWGENTVGQLGDGTTNNRLLPVAVNGLAHVLALEASSAGNHTCALLIDHTVRCWGANSSGQLGDGTTSNRLVPVVVSGLSNAVALAVGGGHSCAMLADGGVQCWGDNSSGQIGDDTTNARLLPVAVTGLSNAVALAAGSGHTCALLADGAVQCWGSNSFGELGDGGAEQYRVTPGPVGCPPDGQCECGAAPLAFCGQACTDTSRDSSNCGGCGSKCALGELCQGGQCECQSVFGYSQCGPDCVYLRSDPMNCGSCGHVCAPGQICGASLCQCSLSTQAYCGGQCIDVSSDPLNCGSCGRACLSTQVCEGYCKCRAGGVLCQGPDGVEACTYTQFDAKNCGACNNACLAGAFCSNGQCLPIDPGPGPSSPGYSDISAGQGRYSGAYPSAVVDNLNGKLLVVTQDGANGGRPALFRCNLDGTGCTFSDLSVGHGANCGDNPSAVVDSANGKLLVVTQDGANENKPALFRCSLDGTGCAYADLSAGQGADTGYLPSAVIDSANRKLLVVTYNGANSYNPALFRCGLDGTGCTYVDLSAGLAVNPNDRPFAISNITVNGGNRPFALIDTENSKLLVLSNNNANDRKPALIRCDLDGTQCAYADVSAGQGPYSGYWPTAVIDYIGGRLLVVTGNNANGAKPGLFRCKLDGSECTYADLSAMQGVNSGFYATAAINAARSKLLVVTDNGANAYKPALFLCNLDGTGCTFTDLSAGHDVYSMWEPSVVVEAANDRLLVVVDSNVDRPALFSIGL
jgi:alpha-tubulin suppressor-like RCC1 family protein